MAAVIPPGAHVSCPDGRLFVTFGTPISSFLEQEFPAIGLPFAAVSDPIDLPDAVLSLPASNSPIPGTTMCAPPNTPTSTRIFQLNRTDSLVTRCPAGGIPGGEILHVTLGQVFDAPSSPACPIELFNPTTGCMGVPVCNTPYVRDVIYTRTSADCGDTWEDPVVLDPDSTPRPPGHTEIAPGANPSTYTFDLDLDSDGVLDNYAVGFDRPEVYADPFARVPIQVPPFPPAEFPITYLTAGVRPPYNTNVLFRSIVPGVLWFDPIEFGTFSPPAVMTSTENGRLFLLHCSGGLPLLYVSDDFGASLVGPTSPLFTATDGTGCFLESSANIVGNTVNAGNGPVIARIAGTPEQDDILIGYPSLIEFGTTRQRQILRLVRVTISRSGNCLNTPLDAACLQISNAQTIDAGVHPTGIPRHVLQPHFIETDRMEWNPSAAQATAANTAILTWLEEDVGLLLFIPFKFFSKRFMWMRGGATFGAPDYLSVQNGVQDGWIPNLPTPFPNFFFQGDYHYGAFYLGEAPFGNASFPTLNYLTLWAESDALPPAVGNTSLHHNVVTMPRF